MRSLHPSYSNASGENVLIRSRDALGYRVSLFVTGLRVTNDCARGRLLSVGCCAKCFKQACAVAKALAYSLFDTLPALGIRVMRGKRKVSVLVHPNI